MASALTTDVTGAVWYAEADAAAIVRYEPSSGASTVFSAGTTSTSMVIAPDGTLWFNSSRSPTMNSLDPASGLVTSHAIGGWAGSLAVGASGEIWFTDPVNRAIARIDHLGTVSSVPVPGAHSPSELTVAPDGRVWFSLDGLSELGVYDPASGLFEDVSTPLPDVTGLTATPAGSIWAGGTDALVRFNLAGSVVETIALAGAWPIKPKMLVPGVHSEIYFRDTDLGIGFLDPSGGVHWQLPPFDRAAPMAMAVTPDGALWFTHRFRPTLGSV